MPAEWVRGYYSETLAVAPAITASVFWDAITGRGETKEYRWSALGARSKNRYATAEDAKADAERFLRHRLTAALANLPVRALSTEET